MWDVQQIIFHLISSLLPLQGLLLLFFLFFWGGGHAGRREGWWEGLAWYLFTRPLGEGQITRPLGEGQRAVRKARLDIYQIPWKTVHSCRGSQDPVVVDVVQQELVFPPLLVHQSHVLPSLTCVAPVFLLGSWNGKCMDFIFKQFVSDNAIHFATHFSWPLHFWKLW